MVAPMNVIQPSISNLILSKSQELEVEGSERDGLVEKSRIPQATRTIYQAVKRGLRRLGSLRRNNSA